LRASKPPLVPAIKPPSSNSGNFGALHYIPTPHRDKLETPHMSD